MTTELRHLHAFRAAAAEPDDDARAAARAALLAEIEAAAQPLQAGHAAPPAPAVASPPRRRRRLLTGVGGLAAAGTVALAIALTSGLGGGDVRPQPASAAEVLRAAADGAELQPYVPLTPGRWWYVKTSGLGDVAGGRPGRSMRVTLPVTTESWTAPGRWSRSRSVFGTTTRFPAERDRRRWVAAGRPWAGTVQDVRIAPSPYDRDETSFARDRLGSAAPGDLPTKVDRLAERVRQIADAGAAAYGGAGSNSREQVWGAAVRLLAQADGPLPPRTRAALFEVLAQIPGVESGGPARDALGRRGTAISLQLFGRLYEELLVVPATGTLLETRSGGSDDSFKSRTTFVASGVVDSKRVRP